MSAPPARAGWSSTPAAPCRPPAPPSARLLSGSGDSGSVTSVRVNGTWVTVTVSVTTGGRASVGTASATAVMGFDRAGG
ncbi:MAG: hypothetical protein V9E89_04220 [Ilumatobacteraceae bacterium]